MNKPFIKSGLIGILAIMMFWVLMTIFPSKVSSLPDGFFIPITAFEFARTPADICQLFGTGNSPYREAIVQSMDLGNKLDFLFVPLYSAFLFLFSVTCAKLSRNKLYYVCCFLVVVMAFGDILENIQLLGITQKLQSDNFQNELYYLHLFTWLKWTSIASLFLIISPYFMAGKGYSKSIGVIGIIPFLLGILAFACNSIVNEIFVLSIVIMFTLMVIYCFIYTNEAA
jgi:hypothetical protein